MSDLIATDNLLNEAQKAIFEALVDTLVPAGEDELMPSASEVDVLSYIVDSAPDFAPQLAAIVDSFNDEFVSSGEERRVQLVQEFEQAQPELFGGLLFHTYARYYQDARVLEGIGLTAGPPFPRGNTVEAGDLSLLDPVMEKSHGYRKVAGVSSDLR
jgi:hypothetical protein